MARPRPIPATLAALVFVTLAGVGASCSTFGSVSLHEYLAENARLICASRVACGNTLDGAACESELATQGEGSAQSLADIDAGKVLFDGSAAAQCLDYRRRHEGDCDTGSLRADPARAACNEVFVGTLGAGAACFTSGECESRSCSLLSCICYPPTVDCPCCAGTCQAVSGLGEECGSALCATGLRCAFDPVAATLLCEPRVEPGEVCTDLFACVDSVACVHAVAGGPSVCGAPPAEGESCVHSEAFECARSDDWCDPEEGICKRRLALDAPCTPSAGSGSCVRYAVCKGGKCSLPPGEGEPCAEVSGPLGTIILSPRCASGLICVNDVCAVNEGSSLIDSRVCK